MRIVVSGYVVRSAIGGMMWHYVQYVSSLARMGHDVLFVEDSGDTPSCYNPKTGERHSADPSFGLGAAASAFQLARVPGLWAYRDQLQASWYGPARERAENFCRSADLLLNVSGVTTLRPWTRDISRRILIDTDPVFTQLRILQSDAHREYAAAHSSFFTFAENVRNGEARLPETGLQWTPTRQPIDIALWNVGVPSSRAPFRTIMQWSSYPPMEFAGERFGVKAESMLRFLELPQRTNARIELAIGSPAAPRKLLADGGWQILDPLEVALTPAQYQEFISDSAGEWSVAKDGYVRAHTGWFSERSAAFLASGRPVVLQDTGFRSWLPTGEGLFAFSTVEQALDAIDRILSDPVRHAKAARQIAEEYFSGDRVLSELLEGCSA